jgi:drug/metabolite transporter (DMT)-like permease
MILVYLGANTLIPYGCLTLAFKYIEASKISIIITLNPVITIIAMELLAFFQVSWIVPEAITVKGFIAAIMVIIGAIMAVAYKYNRDQKETINLIPKRKTPGK